MGGIVTIDAAITEAVDNAWGQPFRWDSGNCALWIADIVARASGIDFAAPLRGRFTTPRGALRVLKRFAGGGLEETMERIAAASDWHEIKAPIAGDAPDLEIGDVCLAGHGPHAVLLIWDGGSAVGREDRGIGYYPGWMVRRAWRVPQCRR